MLDRGKEVASSHPLLKRPILFDVFDRFAEDIATKYVSLFLQRGVNPNEKNTVSGATVLHLAVAKNYLQMVKILVLNLSILPSLASHSLFLSFSSNIHSLTLILLLPCIY